jgi:hypothetical protein
LSLPELKVKKRERASVQAHSRTLTNPLPQRMKASAHPIRHCLKWKKATTTARVWISPPPSVASNARDPRLLLPNKPERQSTLRRLPDLEVALKVQREERRVGLEPLKLVALKLNRVISRSLDRDQGNKNE